MRLRGMLLNAYGWWQMGQIMLISAIVAFCAAGLFLILSALELWHLRRAAPETEVFPKLGHPCPVERRLITRYSRPPLVPELARRGAEPAREGP
jgi:hypothetical protein